jgi:hypothetical protein
MLLVYVMSGDYRVPDERRHLCYLSSIGLVTLNLMLCQTRRQIP